MKRNIIIPLKIYKPFSSKISSKEMSDFPLRPKINYNLCEKGWTFALNYFLIEECRIIISVISGSEPTKPMKPSITKFC